MPAFKTVLARGLLLAATTALMAARCEASTKSLGDREIRREIQWSYDNGARVLLSLSDGRQVTGIVTTLATDAFEIDGEPVAFGAVRMVYRVVEERAPAQSRSRGFGISEKWVWIAWVAYMGTYVVLGILAR